MASNRKVRSLVGLLAGVLALAVFATNASAAGKYKIGVSVADQKSLFYIAAVDGMRAEAKKQGVELVVLSADNNSKQQVNQVNSLITQKVNALIFIAQDATAAFAGVKAANKAKIPVIAVVWQYTGLPPDQMAGRITTPFQRALTTTVNDIEHTKTKARHPQTNGICERFHKTILDEFYRVAFRTKIYAGIDQLQRDLDQWIDHYNTERTHEGKMCCGRTPYATMLAGKEIWNEKVTALNLN